VIIFIVINLMNYPEVLTNQLQLLHNYYIVDSRENRGNSD